MCNLYIHFWWIYKITISLNASYDTVGPDFPIENDVLAQCLEMMEIESIYSYTQAHSYKQQHLAMLLLKQYFALWLFLNAAYGITNAEGCSAV